MTPRLPNSKKWTPLPPELVTQICSVFEEAFEAQKTKGAFSADGRIYTNEILLRVGFLEQGRLAQANFEVSLDFNPNKQNALEYIHLAIDCAASMMETFFAEEEAFADMPTTWRAIDLEGKKVFIQVSTANAKLEKDADKILGEVEGGLVEGTDIEEDRIVVKSMLGLTDEEAEAVAEAEAELEEQESKDGRTRKDH